MYCTYLIARDKWHLSITFSQRRKNGLIVVSYSTYLLSLYLENLVLKKLCWFVSELKSSEWLIFSINTVTKSFPNTQLPAVPAWWGGIVSPPQFLLLFPGPRNCWKLTSSKPFILTGIHDLWKRKKIAPFRSCVGAIGMTTRCDARLLLEVLARYHCGIRASARFSKVLQPCIKIYIFLLLLLGIKNKYQKIYLFVNAMLMSEIFI